MISGKSPDSFNLNATGDGLAAHRKSSRVSLRFRRGPLVAIVAAALLWAGLIAAWRLL